VQIKLRKKGNHLFLRVVVPSEIEALPVRHLFLIVALVEEELKNFFN
jgi:hypothetical protein